MNEIDPSPSQSDKESESSSTNTNTIVDEDSSAHDSVPVAITNSSKGFVAPTCVRISSVKSSSDEIALERIQITTVNHQLSLPIAQPKWSLPMSNYFKETGALFVVFALCMVLALAIREDQVNLRIALQTVYAYLYLISSIWMIWCAVDIIRFRQHWTNLTATASSNQEEYNNIVERNPQNIFYYPDANNTTGLFLKFGAGFLCMGSLLLTVVELAETIEMLRGPEHLYESVFMGFSRSAFIAKSITFILRFFFHCVQFLFLFRYGNLIVAHHPQVAKLGLIHIIIANFCTWFEAIVIETLEELHKQSAEQGHWTTTVSSIGNGTNSTGYSTSSSSMKFLVDSRGAQTELPAEIDNSVLELIEKIQTNLFIYLYPCLIEYSLICVTVFYIMWRNIGRTAVPSHLHMSHRHIYRVNCSRASRGLLAGGIIFLLTILALIPDYVLSPALAVPITHVTELVLLLLALIIVCISFVFTSKLYYDPHGHVNFFDQILIAVTTIGDFAYSFFGLFAAIFIESYSIGIPRSVEISMCLLAIFQTFVQSGFLLDSLRRRLTTHEEIRRKPGREWITALLIVNLTIWLHDSLSAKKVKLNPLQVEYYNLVTWSIVQAFTSPLSIFYRFHSSVCLADIWQEVYDHRSTTTSHLH